jgi:hypothetical protein
MTLVDLVKVLKIGDVVIFNGFVVGGHTGDSLRTMVLCWVGSAVGNLPFCEMDVFTSNKWGIKDRNFCVHCGGEV